MADFLKFHRVSLFIQTDFEQTKKKKKEKFLILIILYYYSIQSPYSSKLISRKKKKNSLSLILIILYYYSLSLISIRFLRKIIAIERKNLNNFENKILQDHLFSSLRTPLRCDACFFSFPRSFTLSLRAKTCIHGSSIPVTIFTRWE